MKPPHILVAGIGNIFLGDDAFGVELAQRLLTRPRPDALQVRDFGIRALDLAYTCSMAWNSPSSSMPWRGARGRFTYGPISSGFRRGGTRRPRHESRQGAQHGMRFGGRVGTVRIVGCEPAVEETNAGLSPPVKAAVDGGHARGNARSHYLAMHPWPLVHS